VIEQLAITASSALISLILLYPLYRLLKHRFIHSFREWGPQHHLEKQAVPTAGGLVFVLMLAIGTISGMYFVCDLADINLCYMPQALFLCAVTFAFALLGFIDDYLKVARHSSRGFPARYKIVLQVVFAAGALYWAQDTARTVFIPLQAQTVSLPLWAYYTLGIVLLVGLVNAFNFTDGLDGLASGMAILSLGANAALFYLASDRMSANYELYAFLTLIMAGSALAFLIVNYKPAQIYMGDTGSYFLGAFIAITAIAGGFMIYLIPLAAIYGIELLSVMMQVVYFRIRKGKRLFKMSPLHHHFELSGVSETGVVMLFWIAQAVVCVLGVAMFILGRTS
jgi:phospho-N-acetylmuramoyl-pentapeptide-transferase